MSVSVEDVWVELDVKGHDHLSVLLFAGSRLSPEELGWSEAPEPSKSLRQLFDALRGSLTGESPTGFDWNQDPGQQRWTITRRADSDVVHVLIEESGARVGDDEEGRNMVLADFEAHLEPLAQAFAQTATRIRNDVGEQSYPEHWDLYPFPTDSLEALTLALDAFKEQHHGEE